MGMIGKEIFPNTLYVHRGDNLVPLWSDSTLSGWKWSAWYSISFFYWLFITDARNTIRESGFSWWRPYLRWIPICSPSSIR